MYKVVITDIKTGDILLDTKMGCANSEHPKSTRLSKLLNIFPNVFLDNTRFPTGCVRDYDQAYSCPIRDGTLLGGTLNPCVVCKQQFWHKEVE